MNKSRRDTDELEAIETFDWDHWAELLHVVHEILGRSIEHIVLYVDDTLITYLTEYRQPPWRPKTHAAF